MNDAMTPALVALSGGGAALASIYVHERAVERAQRESRVAFRLVFPVGVPVRNAVDALAGLTGGKVDYEIIFETRGTSDGIEHYLHVPQDAASATGHQLRAAVPGLRMDRAPKDSHRSAVSRLSARVFIPSSAVLRTDNIESASRSVLGHLADLRENEEVRICTAIKSAAPRVVDVESTLR